MKRMIFLLVFSLLFVKASVFATTFSGYLPGGKNYLDPNNLSLRDTTLETNDPFKVKTNTVYTLSFPPDGILDITYVTVTDGSTILLEGYTNQLSECASLEMTDYCVFTTSVNDTLTVSFDAAGLQQYIDYYGYEGFQLEEGMQPTEYEPYIEPFVDINSPEFSGIATFVKAYYETVTIDQIIQNHILAYDEVDGDLTSSIVVTNDTYTNNMYQAGQYSATLSVSDSSGNTAFMTLYIVVKDEVSPNIIGPDEVFLDVNHNFSLTEILDTYYSASDGHDGLVALQVLTNDYTGNEDMIGIYYVTLYAEDAHQNATQRIIKIHVDDYDAPTIVSNTNQTVYLSQNMTMTEFISSLEFNDNHDNSSSLIVELSSEDPFVSMLPGSYIITLLVSDSSGNQGLFDVSVDIIDDIMPVISGPEQLSVSYTEAPTIEEILSMFTVSDNVDTLTVDQIVIVSETYQSRSALTGQYQLEMELTDSFGNTTNHILVIDLIDNLKPVIYIDQYLVTVTNEVTVTAEDVLTMMINTGEIPTGNYQIQTLRNEYEGNEKIPGTYLYQLLLTDEDGNSMQKELVVKVNDPNTTDLEVAMWI